MIVKFVSEEHPLENAEFFVDPEWDIEISECFTGIRILTAAGTYHIKEKESGGVEITISNGEREKLVIKDDRLNQEEYQKTTWKDIAKGIVVERNLDFEEVWKAQDKRGIGITCPYCDEIVHTCVWSLATTGKRCDSCGALLTSDIAYKKKVEG